MLDLIAYKNTHVPVKNYAINGNFKGDEGSVLADGWSGYSSFGAETYHLKDGVQRIENEEDKTIIINNNYIMNSTDIYYATAMVRTNSDGVFFNMGKTDNSKPVENDEKFHRLSFASTRGDRPRFEIYSFRFVGYVEIKNFVLINLTITFGEGNEPSTEQMDKLLETRFDNGWFDGTKNLFNAKDFMNVYHKKTKELENAIISLGGELP